MAPTRWARWIGRLAGGLALDPAPLRYRQYRLLAAGQAVSILGSAITYVVLPWQVYQLTRSTVAVGLLGVVEFIPMLVAAFAGGTLADRFDRRNLARTVDICLTVAAATLTWNAARPHPNLGLIYLLAAIAAGLGALARPARDALVPRVVPAEYLTAAAALTALLYSGGHIVGPAIAGPLAARLGPAVGYAIDAGSFLVSALILSLMAPVPPAETPAQPVWGTITEGLRYAGKRQELLGTYLIDINAMFFGMPMALFPAIAERFGPGTVGYLYAMPAVGSAIASAASGWTGRVHRHGLAITLAAGVWGVAIIGFGLAGQLPVALGFLILAGAADCVSGIFRMTIWNQTIPDALRGRLAGIEQVSYLSGPYLGNAEAGLVAGAFGVRASVVSGGVLCVIGSVVLGALLPRFIRYDARNRRTV